MAGTTKQTEKGRARGASVESERNHETSSGGRHKPLGEHTTNRIIAFPRSNTKTPSLKLTRLAQLFEPQITVWGSGFT